MAHFNRRSAKKDIDNKAFGWHTSYIKKQTDRSVPIRRHISIADDSEQSSLKALKTSMEAKKMGITWPSMSK
jgi:hypothetical protein